MQKSLQRLRHQSLKCQRTRERKLPCPKARRLGRARRQGMQGRASGRLPFRASAPPAGMPAGGPAASLALGAPLLESSRPGLGLLKTLTYIL